MKSRVLDMSGPAKASPGGQVLTANQRKYFYFSRNYTFPFFISRFIIFQSKCIIFNPKTVIPHHKYKFFWARARPGPARRATKGWPGPPGTRPGGRGPSGPGGGTFYLVRNDYWATHSIFLSPPQISFKQLLAALATMGPGQPFVALWVGSGRARPIN